MEEDDGCRGNGDVGGEESKTIMDELSDDNMQPQSSSMSVSSSSVSRALSSTDQDSSTMVEDDKSDVGASPGASLGGGATRINGPELFNQSFENMDDSMVDNLMILLTRCVCVCVSLGVTVSM